MLVRAGAAYQDIIQVSKSKIQSTQYLVHKLLEGHSSIQKACEEIPKAQKV